MITNLEEGGKIKCQRYWPESGHCEFGPFEVTLIDEQILADYTIRKLQAKVCVINILLLVLLIKMIEMYTVERGLKCSFES